LQEYHCHQHQLVTTHPKPWHHTTLSNKRHHPWQGRVRQITPYIISYSLCINEKETYIKELKPVCQQSVFVLALYQEIILFLKRKLEKQLCTHSTTVHTS
jgi:hypothetical protein